MKSRAFDSPIFVHLHFLAVSVKKMWTIAGFRTIFVTIPIIGCRGGKGLHNWKIM